MPGPLLDTLKGVRQDVAPVWLMRQAGRYLPEYRELRAEKGGFLELVYDSEAAAEITVQPIRRFGFDGAILFSDILIVPLSWFFSLETSGRIISAIIPPLTAWSLLAAEWAVRRRIGYTGADLSSKRVIPAAAGP